jgi:hypothetical protein
MRDPFDKKDCPVFKKLSLMVKWHPRIPENELPFWLVDYEVGHFTGTDPSSQSHAVHCLYFSLFKNETDRSMMVPALCKGETLAVFTADQKITASALSFAACSSAVVVFFLATDPSFWTIGMASFLLNLLYHKIYLLGERRKLRFFKANPVPSAGSFEWYEGSCGFDPVDGSFSAEDEGPLRGYLAESPDLKWLQKVFKGPVQLSNTSNRASTRGFSTIPTQPVGLQITILPCTLIFRETCP